MTAMSPWPKNKLRRWTPFQDTGLDHFGPIYVKGHYQEKKNIWVCLFTCIMVRAFYLEIVADVTAEKFIVDLWRFIALSGKTNEIILDNAAQFKLSKSAIDIVWEKNVEDRKVQSYIVER